MPEFVKLWICHKCGYENYGSLNRCISCNYKLVWLKKGLDRIGQE